jgi:hypothetical protein
MTSGINRRQLARWLAAGAVLGAGPAAVWARDNTALPVPDSLRRVAQAASLQREPLVLLVSLPGCPYCELVRRSYLLPQRAEGLPVWQIDVTDRRTPVRDFADEPSTGAGLARRFGATFTPTVLFFNAQGREVAECLVGVAVPDFYGAYLQEAWEQARKKLS